MNIYYNIINLKSYKINQPLLSNVILKFNRHGSYCYLWGISKYGRCFPICKNSTAIFSFIFPIAHPDADKPAIHRFVNIIAGAAEVIDVFDSYNAGCTLRFLKIDKLPAFCNIYLSGACPSLFLDRPGKPGRRQTGNGRIRQ